MPRAKAGIPDDSASLDELAGFLGLLPRAASDALAARAALRSLPLLVEFDWYVPDEGAAERGMRRRSAGTVARERRNVLLLIRAALLPWLAAGRPGEAAWLRRVARDEIAPATARVALRFEGRGQEAADLACRVAYGLFADQAVFARAAARCLLASMDAIKWAPAARAAMADDLRLLAQHGAGRLRRAPLWPVEPQEWLAEYIVAFTNELDEPGQVQPVWGECYEAMLRGRSPWGLPGKASEAILLDAVGWPEDEWARSGHLLGLRIAAALRRTHAAAHCNAGA